MKSINNNSLQETSRFNVITATFRIWIREYQLIFNDVGIMIILFAVPLLYPVLYSFIYYPEVVRELPVAVVDLSNSTDSRKFSRNMDATPELRIASNCASMEEAIELFKQKKVRGIVLIPASYSKDIAMHRPAVISTYADMEFFLYYKALVSGSSFVALQNGRDLQIQRMLDSGVPKTQASISAEPLKVIDNALTNQAGGFASYGIPAALILIIQQTIVLAIGIMAGTSRERHPTGTLIAPDPNRLGTFRLVIGKSAAYFSIYALLSIYMLGLIPMWFGYARNSNFTNLIALITPFLLSSIFMAMSLSVVFQKRESAMMLFIFTSIPCFFLSGLIWPLSNFGPVWLVVRDLFPSSEAMFGFMKMNSLGASIYETRKEIMTLWIQTGVYFLLACSVYAFQVRKSSDLWNRFSSNRVNSIRQKINSSKSSSTIAD